MPILFPFWFSSIWVASWSTSCISSTLKKVVALLVWGMEPEVGF
jgi:hypothetical protein